MIVGNRRRKRTTQKLRNHCPLGVKLHVVESDDGDHSANPNVDNIDCNLIANNTDSVDTIVKPSQAQKSRKMFQGNQRFSSQVMHSM